MFLQLFNSLRLFHRAGYVHGDLKWENILARRTTTGFDVVLADFEGESGLFECALRIEVADRARAYQAPFESASSWMRNS